MYVRFGLLVFLLEDHCFFTGLYLVCHYCCTVFTGPNIQVISQNVHVSDIAQNMSRLFYLFGSLGFAGFPWFFTGFYCFFSLFFSLVCHCVIHLLCNGVASEVF